MPVSQPDGGNDTGSGFGSGGGTGSGGDSGSGSGGGLGSGGDGNAPVVPEPGSLLMMVVGSCLGGTAWLRRRRKNAVEASDSPENV